MNVASLERIEADIRHLTLDEQLWLMERLVRSIREQTQRQESSVENELARMAADPEVQRELRLIEVEMVGGVR